MQFNYHEPQTENHEQESQEVVENVEQQTNKSLDYNDFMDDFNKPVEDTGDAKTDQNINRPSPEQIKKIQLLNSFSSDVIVSIIDTAAVAPLQFIDNEYNAKDYRADREKVAIMNGIVSEMLPRDKTVMPLWAQLIIVLLATYTPLYLLAFKNRNLKNQLAEKDALLQAQDQKMAEMQKRIENLTIERTKSDKNEFPNS
jgi:hypothetical protein